MDNQIKKQVPKSALALYVKLFCKKKGSKSRDNKVLIDATKSWLALNKNDKQQFIKKYNEYQNNIKKAFANYLITAEPYLKAKELKEIKTPEKNTIDENAVDMNCDEEIEPLIIQDQNNLSNVDNTFLSPRVNHSQHDTSMQFVENANNPNHMIENSKFSNLIEPTPPKFVTGAQLFSMLNNGSHLSWSKLNSSQKVKYYNAVSAIKKKYLKNYKQYLEQLPPEKLFEHYKNCI